MGVKTETPGDVTVFTLSGKLNTEASQDLKDGLYANYASSPGHMLIDMKNVSYVSSYLIGVLVGCHKLLKKSGCGLHLSGLSSHLRTVLEVSGPKCRSALRPSKTWRTRCRRISSSGFLFPGRQRSWLENASSITEGVADERPLHFLTSTSALTLPWPI
jgi:anti-sigma B factor antagonist